MYIYGNEMVL